MCENIIYDRKRGEYVCADTGEILEDHIPEESPFITSYTPISNFVHDFGLSSEIEDKVLEKRNLITRASDRFSKRLIIGSRTIKKVCFQLALPNYVCEEAMNEFRKVMKTEKYMRNIDQYAVAILYVVSKRRGLLVSFEDFKQFAPKLYTILYKLTEMGFKNELPNMEIIKKRHPEVKVNSYKELVKLIKNIKQNKSKSNRNNNYDKQTHVNQ